MPESVKDRPSTVVETIFMLTKSQRYFYDAEAVKKASKPASANRYNYAFGGAKSEHLTAEEANGAGSRTHPIGNRETNGMRTRRSSDWFFESWQGMLQDEEGDPLAFVVNTRPYRAAHFATFPPDLIRPMIRASTSEKGCCPECGAPQKRVLAKIGQEQHMSGGERDRSYSPDREGGEVARRPADVSPSVVTTGWEPTCTHTHTQLSRCTVLDPFGGSGTTAQVALELGHNAILCELNPEYIPLIRERCAAALAAVQQTT